MYKFGIDCMKIEQTIRSLLELSTNNKVKPLLSMCAYEQMSSHSYLKFVITKIMIIIIKYSQHFCPQKAVSMSDPLHSHADAA